MMQCRHHLRFPLEGLNSDVIPRQRVEELDGNGSPRLVLHRPVYYPHSPLSDPFQQIEAGNAHRVRFIQA
jgi:hypothetical protein